MASRVRGRLIGLLPPGPASVKILDPLPRFRPNRRIPLIATTVPALLLVGLLGAAPADHATLELRYHGSLAKPPATGIRPRSQPNGLTCTAWRRPLPTAAGR